MTHTRMLRLLALAIVALPATLSACGRGGDTVDAADEAALGQALLDDPGSEEAIAATDDADVDQEAALDEADPAASCELGALRGRVVARYDVDGDGALSADERAALAADVEGRPLAGRVIERHRLVRRAIAVRLRFVYDADNSGALDETERLTLRDDLLARCEARRAQVLARFDADGSGALDATEKAAAKDAVRAHLGDVRDQLLANFDADADGRLNADERDAAKDAARRHLRALRAELFARFDGNDDHRLSDDEKAALREFLRSRIRLEEPSVG